MLRDSAAIALHLRGSYRQLDRGETVLSSQCGVENRGRGTMETYEPVAFVALESGDDLIVSFFVPSADDPSDGRSITLLRDVKWEHLLPDEERGVKVSDEAEAGEEFHENYLEEIRVGEAILELKSTQYARKLDLRMLSRADRKAITKVLKKMNADRRFRLKVA